MILNNQRMQKALRKLANVTINHTKTHTVITRDDYSCHIHNIKKDEKASSHRLLWDEKKNFAPLNGAHLVLRAQVSLALGEADDV